MSGSLSTYYHGIGPSLAERAARQIATLRQQRLAVSLTRLEHETRRMLQLEEALGAFALQYINRLGETAARLEMLEQEMPGTRRTIMPALEALPAMQTQLQLRAARRKELKRRYRMLAKQIHPDRAMVVEAAGDQASHMRVLNAAYQHGDLAALLKLEARIALEQVAAAEPHATRDSMTLDQALREIDRAADTYASGYRALLHCPVNRLMLHTAHARQSGWDWLGDAIVKLERIIAERERLIHNPVPVLLPSFLKAA